jgi:DNA-binding transcriptional regulator YhcF (GntR family)
MAGRVPKYSRVKSAILENIRSGKYQLGDQLPTREELVRRFKVTRTTINKALGELLQEGVIKSSRRRGTFVAQPHPPLAVAVVSVLAAQIVPSTKNEPNDLQRMFGNMMLHAGQIQYKFFDDKALHHNLGPLQPYEAVVWVQPDDQTLAILSELGRKVLVTNRYPDNLNFISTNHRSAMAEVTGHYLKLCGTQAQVFYLDPPFGSFVYRERKEGFINACSQHRHFYRLYPVENDFAKIFKTVKDLPFDTARPVVIISPSSIFTGAVLAAAKERGLRFGKNFFYADFDNAAAKERYGVPVTTIIQDYAAMGMAVVEALNDLGKKPIRIYIPYIIEGLIGK